MQDKLIEKWGIITIEVDKDNPNGTVKSGVDKLLDNNINFLRDKALSGDAKAILNYNIAVKNRDRIKSRLRIEFDAILNNMRASNSFDFTAEKI